MNYTITKEWQTISEIMGEDYDATKQYRIHNNIGSPNILCLTEIELPSDDILGKLYPQFAEIYIEAQALPSLRVLSSLNTNNGFDVEISSLAE